MNGSIIGPRTVTTTNSAPGIWGIDEVYSDTLTQRFPKLAGFSAGTAVPSAAFLTANGNSTNGVYWINLPTVGPTQIYCILDPTVAGGGWMMAIKGTRGSTFTFSSTYWTSIGTLNPADTTRNDGDAKFSTWDYYPTNDWLAVFPDVASGGDISNGGGWSWYDQAVSTKNGLGTNQTPLSFMQSGREVTVYSNGVYGAGSTASSNYQNGVSVGSSVTATTPTPLTTPKINSSIWSYETGFQWYGYNWQTTNVSHRWGFGWNNESDQTSPDAFGGIGTNFSSCQDNGNGLYGSVGTNRTMRFEWYIR
jgi:hypothetical protein